MIQERRNWVSTRWRFLFILPALIAGAGLFAISHRSHELLAGGPILLLMIYSVIVLMIGGTRVEVDERGFRLKPGPLPAGVRTEEHTTDVVRHLFPRHIYENVAKNVWEHRYYAAVELANGRWVNVRGHYPDWAKASASCLEIAHLWRLAEVAAGRSGFPNKRDWTAARVVLLWGGAYIVALLWGLAVEILRTPIYLE